MSISSLLLLVQVLLARTSLGVDSCSLAHATSGTARHRSPFSSPNLGINRSNLTEQQSPTFKGSSWWSASTSKPVLAQPPLHPETFVQTGSYIMILALQDNCEISIADSGYFNRSLLDVAV
ncbi:MAG: hypothetical protein BYD32DRAFT_438417 [Podila humilis]|nr:MAG: hypothetical protein BYD32DRAFT_438417 [Podila humilis]